MNDPIEEALREFENASHNFGFLCAQPEEDEPDDAEALVAERFEMHGKIDDARARVLALFQETKEDARKMREAAAGVMYRVKEFGRSNIVEEAFGWSQFIGTDAGQALNDLRLAANLKVEKSNASPYGIIVSDAARSPEAEPKE